MLKYSFKKLVMKKAKEFEFIRFLQIKDSKSKMQNISYTCLEMQDYLLLKNMNISQAKAMFKLRVKMAPFGGNFRGGREKVLCPLCHLYPDGLKESFPCDCEKMTQIMDIKENISKQAGAELCQAQASFS